MMNKPGAYASCAGCLEVVMDKGDTIKVTEKFRNALKDLPSRYPGLTETEINAIGFADVLYQKELAELQFNANYKGIQ